MGTLRVVRAGAGSGKTYDLSQTVARRVVTGLDPARLLATTFTRKAAAELKKRIEARILAEPALSPSARRDRAERLELAVIGTVDSVAREVVSRHAIALGLSPRLDVLEEEAGRRAIDDLVARTERAPWEALADVGRRLSIDDAHETVLQLLYLKRANQLDDARIVEDLTASGERLCAIMSPGGLTARPVSFDALYDLAGAALTRIKGLGDTTAVTDEALTRLRALFWRRAGVWGDFLTAAKLKAGKRSGADAALADLRSAGARLLDLPGLHADIRAFLALLGERTVVVSRAYEAYKRERGLVDFVDLEVLLLRLLETDPLAAAVAADFDLVIVDEFQDTSPLQLTIFERLRALTPASRWVGDAKQAIYGFRGTDPALVNAVWDAVPEADRERLPRNYRSQAGLVDFVGCVFRETFGAEAGLEATRAAAPRGVERWVFSGKNKGHDFAALAAGIRALRAEGSRLRDIAVLARSNLDTIEIGAACAAAGIPALLDLPGLLRTREGALALAGLRVAADRHDGLAAATIEHLLHDPGAATPAWLDVRLRAVRAAEDALRAAEAAATPPPTEPPPFAGSVPLGRLGALDVRGMPPSIAVEQVLGALDVAAHIRRWGEAARRLANLDGLLSLARAYEDGARALGEAATLTGLITHLERLAEAQQDVIRPPYGIDAVTVLTYHRAKGLEWPVVVLAGLDFDRVPDLWSPVVMGGEGAGAGAGFLGSRRLRYWPWPLGRNSYNGHVLQGSGLETQALATAEGQAVAARDAAERIRLLYVGCTRARDKLVLSHRERSCASLEALPEIARLLPETAAEGGRVVPELRTSLILRRIDGERAQAAGSTPLPDEEAWLAVPREPAGTTPALPRYRSPSAAEGDDDAREAVLELCPGGPIFLAALDEEKERDVGKAVHAYFAALPALAGCPDAVREATAERCLRGFAVEGILAAGRLVALGERFRAWTAGRYPGAAWRTEVPLSAPGTGGAQWYGIADLLLVREDGSVVLIDHKSGSLAPAHCAAKARSYAGQIDAYREVLAACGVRVAEAWIHFPLAGAVVRLGCAGGEAVPAAAAAAGTA